MFQVVPRPAVRTGYTMKPHCVHQFGRLILSLLLAVIPCGSTLLVYLKDAASHSSPLRFEDVPAMDDFGPRIPSNGFSGRLRLAKPDVYACSSIYGPKSPMGPMADIPEQTAVGSVQIPETSSRNSTVSKEDQHERLGGTKQGLRASAAADVLPAAVLVSRSIKSDQEACTFQTKTALCPPSITPSCLHPAPFNKCTVLNAQTAGYSLVVVYDSEQGNMFKMGMSSSNDDNLPTVDIPLVLVTHSSGLALMSLMSSCPDHRGLEVSVDNVDPFVGMLITVNVTMFVIIMGFMLALLACGTMMVLTLHRYLRRYEDLVAGSSRPMSLREVLQLPEVQVEDGSRLEGDSCPVCLEAYRAGDKLLSLPCHHAFHAGCIMPWLTERQRTCPMCKDPVCVGSPLTPPSTVNEAIAPSSSSSETFTGRGRLERGVERTVPGTSGVGDRLPLLSNSRGPQSSGGSIQEASPV